MRIVVRCATLAVLLMPSNAGAQSLPLTEADAMARLSPASPRVRAIRAGVDVARADVLAAGRWPNPRVTFDREAVAGVTGHFGAWTAEASVQYGRNVYELDFGPNNRKQREFADAVDAVVNPATGNVVCRSGAAGCIPVNVFGDGSLALNDYVNGTARFRLVTRQAVASANVRGVGNRTRWWR